MKRFQTRYSRLPSHLAALPPGLEAVLWRHMCEFFVPSEHAILFADRPRFDLDKRVLIAAAKRVEEPGAGESIASRSIRPR